MSITQRAEKLHTNGEASPRLRQRYEDPSPPSVLRAHGISKPTSKSFLDRPAQNWRALERRAAGLPPEIPYEEAERWAAALLDHSDLFGPIIRALVEGVDHGA